MKADIDLLKRVDEVRLHLARSADVPLTIFARPEVPIEMKAVTELLQVLQITDTLRRLHEVDFLPAEARLEQVAVTPDFHKDSGIPIGTVLATRGFLVPQAIGNDINCGMRLHTTHLTQEQVLPRRDELEHKLRYLFFEGGRNIPMTRKQRQASIFPPAWHRRCPNCRRLVHPASEKSPSGRSGFDPSASGLVPTHPKPPKSPCPCWGRVERELSGLAGPSVLPHGSSIPVNHDRNPGGSTTQFPTKFESDGCRIWPA